MNRLRSRWIGFALLVFATLLVVEILPAPDSLLIWKEAIYSDLTTGHLPISLLVHRSVGEMGQFPFWNPVILGGQPLVGDPLAGVTYPPHWLTYLFPTLAAYNLLLWLHLLLAGWGVYRLARALGLSKSPALAASLAFAGTPRLMGQWSLGHVTLTYAVSWTPWLLFATHRAMTSGPNRQLRRFALAGGILGGMVGIDPRWGPPAGLLAALLGLYLWYAERQPRLDLGALAGAGLGLAAAAGTSAALLLPMWQFTELSTRAALSVAEGNALALPPAGLFQVLLPQAGAWPEWQAGLGTAVVLLAILGVVRGRKVVWLWLAVAFLGWMLSLGPTTPLYDLARVVLPGMSLARVPARFTFLAALAGSLLAGEGMEALEEATGDSSLARRLRLAALAGASLVVLSAVGLTIAIGLPSTTDPLFPAWPALVAFLSCLLVFESLGSRGRRRAWQGAALALVAVDLLFLGLGGVERRPAALKAPPSSVVAAGWGEGRTYSPSYAIGQAEAAAWEVEMADGVHPLQLAAHWDFMADTASFDSDGYRVTLPPFPGGDPKPRREVAFDLPRFGLLNVTAVVSDYRLKVPGLKLLDHGNGIWVYRNPEARPRAWVQASADLDPAGSWTEASILEWSPNRIEMEADGPGVLVVSEHLYPGWRAAVDGAPVEVIAIGGVLRGTHLEAGAHRIDLAFRPDRAILGAAVTAAAWLLVAGLWRRGQ